MRTRADGFTLVEIVVVLALAALLSVIFLSVFGRVRENGRRTTCQSNLRQLNSALRHYVSDNDGVYPDSSVWPQATLPYVKSRALYECSTEVNDATLFWTDDTQTDYEMNGKFLNSHIVNFKRSGVNESKTTPADADGHVKWLNPQGFAAIYCYLKSSLP